MIIAGPIDNSACTIAPSEPGRLPSSTASNTRTQKSIAAAGSRQNNRGITRDEFSGIPLPLGIRSSMLENSQYRRTGRYQRTDGPFGEASERVYGAALQRLEAKGLVSTALG
jgi:hypothetical protein